MWRFLCNLGPYLSFCYRPPSKCYLRCQPPHIPPIALNPYLAPSFVPIQDIPYLIRSSITFCSGYSIKHHYHGLTWGPTRERTNDPKPGICFFQTWFIWLLEWENITLITCNIQQLLLNSWLLFSDKVE